MIKTKALVSLSTAALLIAAIGLFSSCGVESDPSGSPQAPAATAGKSYAIGVSNMTWGSCSSTVRATLSKLDGVIKVHVNLQSHTANVVMREGVELDEGTVKTALAGKGFGVRSFAPDAS